MDTQILFRQQIVDGIIVLQMDGERQIDVLLDVRKDRSLDIYVKNVVCIHTQIDRQLEYSMLDIKEYSMLDIKEYSMLDIKIDVQK